MNSDQENGEMENDQYRSPQNKRSRSRSLTPQRKADNGDTFYDNMEVKDELTNDKSLSRSRSKSKSRSRSLSRDRSLSRKRSRSRSGSRKFSRSPSKNRSRSRSASRKRSHSRSRSPKRRRRSRSRKRSRSRGRRSPSREYRRRKRSRSRTPPDGARIHISELDSDTRKRDLEKLFEKYGSIREVWMAHNPPCFAFVVYDRKKDADEAIRYTNGLQFGHNRIRVTMARPRTRGWRNRSGYDPNLRCYQCGELGHFSRNCSDTKFGYKRPPTPRRGSRRRSRSRSRS